MRGVWNLLSNLRIPHRARRTLAAGALLGAFLLAPTAWAASPGTILADGFEERPCPGYRGPMRVDGDGFEYCLVLEYGQPQAGVPLQVTGRVWHENSVYRIYLTGNYPGNYQSDFCNGDYCEKTIEINQVYAGKRTLGLNLWAPDVDGVGNHKVDEITEEIEFGCAAPHCPPNPVFNDFFDWMRAAGYAECVVAEYLEPLASAPKSAVMEGFIALNGQIATPAVNVRFYDIIPTDAAATHQSMAAGEAPLCDIDSRPSWPFCPSPGQSADYLFVEQNFRDAYGLDIRLEYVPLPISYVETFGGEPQEFQSSGEYQFDLNAVNAFVDTLEDGSIAHFAIETYDGNPIRQTTGSRLGVAIHYHEPTALITSIAYSHEWGHAMNMGHSFLTDPDGGRDFIGLDGVMSNTYRGISDLKDPTDPLERYAMKPASGDFTDAATFAADYTAGLLGGGYLPVCEDVDLAFAGQPTLDPEFGLQIDNHGGAATGYYTLSWYEGCSEGVLLGELLMPYLGAGDSVVLGGNPPPELATGDILMVLDAGEKVAESNEDNNSLCVPQVIAQ